MGSKVPDLVSELANTVSSLHGRPRSADLASDTEEEEERELGDYTAKTGVGPGSRQ